MRWWEQEGMGLEGIRKADREADRTEGEDETDRKESATADELIGDDTIVNITLGTESNAPLAYAPVLELHQPIMSKLGEHGGQ